MQYILTEEELNKGCPLIKMWTTEDMSIDVAYEEQERLNQQGFFTIIDCSNIEKEWYRITVFQRDN